jgi:hypothetical protein
MRPKSEPRSANDFSMREYLSRQRGLDLEEVRGDDGFD